MFNAVCGEGGGGNRHSGLYVLCEKGGGWSVRGCESVPVEYPDTRNSKHAFKKLLRACVPSQPPPGPDPDSFRPLHLQAGSYYRSIIVKYIKNKFVLCILYLNTFLLG